MNNPLPPPTLYARRYAVRGSLYRLVSCVRSLGPTLGWKYWRVGQRARKNPDVVREWAARCRREAVTAPEPMRSYYLEWADKLDGNLQKWLRQVEAATMGDEPPSPARKD